MPGRPPDTCAPRLELSLRGDGGGSLLFWGVMTWEKSPCFGRENTSKACRNFLLIFIISWVPVIFAGTIWSCRCGAGWPLRGPHVLLQTIMTIRGLRCSYFCSAQLCARGTGCMQFINKYLLFWVMTEREGISWLRMAGWKSWNPPALGCQAMPKPTSHYYIFFLLWPLLFSPVQTCALFPCQPDKNKHVEKITPPHPTQWSGWFAQGYRQRSLPCCR